MQVAKSVRPTGYRLRSPMKSPSCWDATAIAWSCWMRQHSECDEKHRYAAKIHNMIVKLKTECIDVGVYT